MIDGDFTYSNRGEQGDPGWMQWGSLMEKNIAFRKFLALKAYMLLLPLNSPHGHRSPGGFRTSKGLTVSLPAGSVAPVLILTAVPVSTSPENGCPAWLSPMTLNDTPSPVSV